MSESKRQRENRKRRERAVRAVQREQQRLAIMHKRDDGERREHLRRLADRSPLKPDIGDIVLPDARDAVRYAKRDA